MRAHAGTTNRVWLTILGLLCLAAGVWILLLASGVLGRPEEPVLAGPPETLTGSQYAPVTALVAGLLLGLLGLWWLLAQIPRRRAAGEFRLQEDPARGITVCNPPVLAAAVESATERIPGVRGATALVRGTPEEPDLTLKVTVSARADIRAVVDRIQQAVVPDLALALGNPLNSLGIQVEVGTRAGSADSAVSSTGTVVY